MSEELDDLLEDVDSTLPEQEDKGEIEPEKEPEVEATAETEEPEKEPEKEDETPTSEEDSWTKTMALDERRKRQDAERELSDMKAAMIAQNKPEMPDLFDDPDGAISHVKGEMNEARLVDKVNLSRDMMAMMKDDYEDMEKTFVDMAKADPNLTDQMLNHANPARFAYDVAQKAQQYNDMQNVDEYKSKLKAEIRNELLSEMKADGEKSAASEAKKSLADVPSLANEHSSGGFTTPTDQTLDEIMGG